MVTIDNYSACVLEALSLSLHIKMTSAKDLQTTVALFTCRILMEKRGHFGEAMQFRKEIIMLLGVVLQLHSCASWIE